MDKYTLQEQAYKKGFQDGFAEGAERGKSEWIYGSTSEIICKACGTRQAKFYGDGLRATTPEARTPWSLCSATREATAMRSLCTATRE